MDVSQITPYTAKFFDLQRALTTNVDFINAVEKKFKNIMLAERADDRQAWRDEIMDLLRLCDYNPALLASYFFPKFSRGKPMTFWTRPHAFAMLTMGANLTLTVQASRQVGKCVTGDTMLQCRHEDQTTTRLSMSELFEDAKRQAAESAKAD